MRSPFLSPYQQSARSPRSKKAAGAATGAADFLRAHDKMASMLPAVTRMIALQKDCAAALPSMFVSTEILQFESGQLVLSTPNAALATKLKQQLPKLQDTLLKLGWQVSAIRLKVQVSKSIIKITTTKQLSLSDRAVDAFAALGEELDASPRNAALKAALLAMARRAR
jgi:hypothetical protein